MSNYNHALFRVRWLLVLSALLFVGYVQGYYSQTIPDGLGVIWRWQPDTNLRIVVIKEKASHGFQIGDLVLALDDRVLIQTQPIFIPPVKKQYTATVERDGHIKQVEISGLAGTSSPLTLSVLVGTLTIMAGAAILFVGKADDLDALQLGLLLVFLGVSFVGMKAAQMGVPFTWLIGYVSLHFLPVSILYQSWLPGHAAIPKKIRTMLKGALLLALVGALLAWVEVVWLFPTMRSLQQWTGFSLIRSLYAWIVLSLLLYLITLVARSYRATHAYTRHQLRILVFFLVLALLPAVLLTIVPSMLFDIFIVPAALSFSLFGLIPISYVYIIYRRRSLMLDQYVGRTLLFVMLLAVAFAFYVSLLQLMQPEAVRATDFRYQAFLLILVLGIVAIVSTPLKKMIQWMLSGEVNFTMGDVHTAAQEFALSPEPVTLQRIVEDVAEKCAIGQSLLLIEDERQETRLIFKTELHNQPPIPRAYPHFSKVQYPTTHSNLGTHFPWAKLILPVWFAERQVGFYALAAPEGCDYFDGRQVAVFLQLTHTIAIGVQGLYLFDSAEILTAKMKQARADERAKIARRLHSDPIQSLLAVKQLLQLVDREDPLLSKASEGVQDIANSLREISHDLRDSVIDKHLDSIVYAVIEQFEARVGTPFVDESLASIEGFIPRADVAFAVYEILTEVFNNIYRHAKATAVKLSIQRNDSELAMRISDNGVGMPQPVSISKLTRSGVGMGIVDMNSHARSVNGTLSFEKNQYGGVTVHCVIPHQGGAVL